MSRAQESEAQRYEALKRLVAEVPPVRRGSVVKRFMPCGKPGCRCQAKPPRLHGPYFQWTRKVNGTTATSRINEEQARLLGEWIENGRRLDRLVDQMEQVSLRLTEKILRAARSP